MSVIRNQRRKGWDSKGKSGESSVGQTTDSEKGQIGDLGIQQEDFIEDVMVLVFHDQAGSEKRLDM